MVLFAMHSRPKGERHRPRIRGGSRASGFVKKLVIAGKFDPSKAKSEFSEDLIKNHSSYASKWGKKKLAGDVKAAVRRAIVRRRTTASAAAAAEAAAEPVKRRTRSGKTY
jgi:hypothetical protein